MHRRCKTCASPGARIVVRAYGMDRARASLLAELRSYTGLDAADAELLSCFRPLAEPHFRAIADEFYAVIRMHEGAFAVLQDEAQARRLHASLQVWLGELLSGPYDARWVERHAHIGEVHVRVGLEPRYMVTAMNRVRVSLQRIAADALGAGAAATQLAISRVCDVDLAIMLESYKDHLLGRVERARLPATEPSRARLDRPEGVLRDALEAADVVLLGFDGQGRLAIANQKAAELTGYAEDELVDADVLALLFGERAPAMREALLGATERGPVDLEAEVRTRAGKTRLVRWRASAHTTPSGAGGSAIVLVGMDVTREREFERRARQNERLAAAGALAAGLAHEIRNPLNGANLHVSVLDRALARTRDVPPAAREATDVLRAEIRRLSALVTDFLEVARPKPLMRREYDVNEVARSVGTLIAPEAELHKVALRIEAFPFPAVAQIDPERIKQLLVNLVRNALEAVKDGGTVVVCVRRLPHEVEVDVVDDGPGIADSSAPIFDAFFTTKDRGTGLGLSIVQRIATDHGGDVSFASRPGETTFTVRLPTTTRPG
jgi:PAS domain S-box-containing protein